jgi:hypothetical protein
MQASPQLPHRWQPVFTALAAILFCAGITFLFVSLYHQSMASALITSAVLFVGTVICWVCSAISAPPLR